MRIILNSDILFHGTLVTRFSKRLDELFKVCAQQKHVVVIPKTTLLEFDRIQAELVESAIAELTNACDTLSRFKVPYSAITPADAVKQPNLIALITDYGVEVLIEEPTLEDFNEAHRRACLHKAPHPAQSKSDEMRDLVIWMIALRLSRKHAGALLISRDHVHVCTEGDSEASAYGLSRARDVEQALEMLAVETPAGRLLHQMLQPAWDSLLRSGLPLPNAVALARVSEARFLQGELNPTEATARIALRTTTGGSLTALLVITATAGRITRVELCDICIDGKTWVIPKIQLDLNEPLSIEKTDYDERLEGLNNAITPEKP